LPSILGNLADPLIYMLGLGYGLGADAADAEGQPYVAFLAAGTVCASTMNAATFEALYSAHFRGCTCRKPGTRFSIRRSA
jgi:lipooligosaccharide transport system permease protein